MGRRSEQFFPVIFVKFMRNYIVVLLLGLTTFSACSPNMRNNGTFVEVYFQNSSTNSVWVEFDWEGPDIPVGILSPGANKGSLDVPWPYVGTAKLTIIEEEQKTHSVDVSLADVNEKLRSGKHTKVGFSILNYERADVSCQ